MSKICITIVLFAILTVVMETSGTHTNGQECRDHKCLCCVVPFTRCERYRVSDDYCLDGCKDGIYGYRCYNQCPAKCATCSQNSGNSGYPCTQCTDQTKYGYSCTTSCSAGCDSGTCNIDGSCICIAGYSGDTCATVIVVCPENCQTCASSANCSTCVDGYYNGYKNGSSGEVTYVCKHSCSVGCDDGTCDTNGRCTCKAGYSGDRCDIIICPDNCQTCTSQNNCQTCVDGYYHGYKNGSSGEYTLVCKHLCSAGCDGGTCNTNGSCTCKAGYSGDRCDVIICPDNCQTCKSQNNCPTCVDGYYNGYKKGSSGEFTYVCKHSCSAGCDGGTCNTNGSCTCKAGYSGDRCDIINVICSDNCQTCASSANCQTCVSGFYNGYKFDLTDGEYTSICEHTCRPSCKACSGYSSCITCIDGYYGDYCEQSCSTGCQAEICDKVSGECTCKSGFSGDKCDQCVAGKYSDDCTRDCVSQNCNNTTCDRDSGRCLSCNTGSYGNNLCDKLCPTSCKYGTCDFSLGTCTHGCISAYSGDKCCLNNNNCETCSSNTHCSVCVSGYSGDKCCVSNDRCVTCSSPSACSQCIPGFSGKACNCPINCETCDENGQCQRCIAGYDNIITNCSECVRNKYGANCQTECSDNCLNNGELSNCGKSGMCINECKDGYYGDKCDLRCNQNCKQFVCSRSNGECSHGCQDGFTRSGSECVSEDTEGVPVAVFGGAIGGSVAFGGIIAVIVVLLIKRRKNRPLCGSVTTTESPQSQEDSKHTYVNTIDTALDNPSMACATGNSDYQELNEMAPNVPVASIDDDTETATNDYESLNEQQIQEEQDNYDKLVVTAYENTKINK